MKHEIILVNMYMLVCLTWSSSITLNRHHVPVCPLGQPLGRGHLAGGSRLSVLHHRRPWEGGVRGTDRPGEALTWTPGVSCVLHSNLNTWKRQIWSEGWGRGCRSERHRCRARCLEAVTQVENLWIMSRRHKRPLVFMKIIDQLQLSSP